MKADNGNQGMALVGGHPSAGSEREEPHGEPGHTLHLAGKREFHLADPVRSVTFPDGSTWTPEG